MTFGVVLFTILIQGISVEPLDEDRRLAVDGGDARAGPHKREQRLTANRTRKNNQ